jgi:ATP-dependent helicase Lhr and Lhr-like helicase
MSSFSPRVREWFTAAFAAPTPAQELAWPAIARGENVLLSAPTGSGKTLAAFLWALDRLSAGEGGRGTRVVYVSPLKALAYDIERNLRAPLRGIDAPGIGVGIRTGDTPQRERAAMLRKPPDILITTPESLYLLLSSRARETLGEVQAVIVDEIHAVAETKRGSHLALTLERLEAQALADRPAGAALQRIGLSATQRPLEEIGRYLVGPGREVTILDAGVPPALDLRIEVPVESMSEPDAGPSRSPESAHDPLEPTADPLEPVPGGESLRGSIWPAIYPELLRLVREHNSTIVFVNNRRSAERVALRLNELAAAQREGAESAARSESAAETALPAESAPTGKAAPAEWEPLAASASSAPVEIARAHHGSLAREERTVVEELLKSGELPCLVATSSLELGIDMGAVDLVLQIESPKSVARGLQRIGRAGHGVGEVSRGRIFPKFRGDLLECAVLARRMREGAIESTVIPRNALDVLAQQIVAIAVSTEPDGASGEDGEAGAAGVSVDDLYALVTCTYSYAELSRALLEHVLDMLDGRYPSREFGELRARIVWNRVAGVIRARRGARQLVVTNAGTIPDRGLYAVTLPDGRRVGELDEEMVYEARPGQAFLLGASTWRIEEIGRDRVIVTPAPGAPGAVPFWKGDAVGRPRELGEAIGAFSRWAVEQQPAALARDYALDERAARNLLDYLREQQAATRVLPSDRTIVLERFRDEIGDWRLCLLSPYGGRVHAAWGLALSARIRAHLGVEADAIWSDDGIVLHLPDLDAGALDGADESGTGEEVADRGVGSGWGAGETGAALPSLAELVLIEPEEVESAIMAELGDSALFGARFREAASRALLIPRAYPGKRTPLWQQRLKAQNLLDLARRYADFPIVLETYRECLRDVLDVAGLQSLLRDLHAREISLVEVETPTASPFASSLLFDYIATYMYEGDAPNAERRAAALSLDRELLRELLGSEELRELIDPGALRRVEDELQRRTEMTRATDRDSLHDVLRRVGDLTREEVAERVLEGIDPGGLLDELQRERRAIRVRVGGEERYIAADEAGLYRDALGAVPPGGLPEAFLANVSDALRELIARYARTHGPFTAEEVRERYRVDASAVLRELERAGDLVLGELRPGGAGREWCDVEVLRRLRRASLAVLRREVEPAERTRLATFMPSWQSVDRHSGAGSGIDRLREVLVPLQGLALPVEIWEREVLPRRTGAYSPTWLDALCASGEVVWVGAGALGRSGRVAVYFRDDAPVIGSPPSSSERRDLADRPEVALLRARLAQGPCFFTDLLAEIDAPAEALREALWDLVWAGEVTNDAWAPLRAPRLTLARGERSGRAAGALPARPMRRTRFGARRTSAGAGVQVQGRWSLAASIFLTGSSSRTRFSSSSSSSSSSSGGGGGVSGPEHRRALAELLLERYGIVTREQVLAERIEGGFAGLYDTFCNLETLGVCRRGYFIEGMGGAQFALPGAVERLRATPAAKAGVQDARALVIAAADPAQPYGAALPWPRDERREGRRPARVAGAYVVLVAGEPVLYVERGGRGLITLVARDEHLGAAWGTEQTGAQPGGQAGEASSFHVPGVRGEEPIQTALRALAEAVRAGCTGRLALERIDGEPAVGSRWEPLLAELGFSSGPRRLTLSA